MSHLILQSIINKAAEPADNEYVSFPELIDAMIADPSGNFILDADMFADDMSINASTAAYVTTTFTGTLTGNMKKFICDLQFNASLFSTLSRATVQDFD